MVRIPSEYQEVEYIESTGAQWIATNIEGRFSMTFESDIEFTGNQDSYSVGFLDGNFRMGANGYYGTRTQISYGAAYASGIIIIFNKKYKYKTIFEPNIQKVFINDKLTSTHNLAQNVTELTGKHIGIFARLNNDNGASLFSKVKMYNLKISDENELLGNFIPCYHKTSGEIGMYDTVSKQFYTNSGTGTFLKGNDVTYDNINLLESRRRILLNTPHIETVSDIVASFKTDVATKLKGCKIHFTPIQEGEGDPSPENVRPIHGWDEITVTKCGKNLAPLFSNTDFWSMAAWFDGEGIIHNDDNYRMCDYKIVSPGKKYVLSTTTACWKGIGFYDELYNPLKFNQQNAVSIELTCPDNAKYYRVYTFYNGINIQFEEGSIATEYEPYQSTTLTITFPQTIYGGYVDLIKGEVVEEYQKVIVNDETNLLSLGVRSNTNVATHRYIRAQDTGTHIATAYGLSNMFASSHDILWYYPNASNVWAFTINAYALHFVFDNDVIGINSDTSDADRTTAIQAWLASKQIVFAIPLATPNVYPLTPQTIKALKGLNNLWSDANGNIEVSFYTH